MSKREMLLLLLGALGVCVLVIWACGLVGRGHTTEGYLFEYRMISRKVLIWFYFLSISSSPFFFFSFHDCVRVHDGVLASRVVNRMNWNGQWLLQYLVFPLSRGCENV